MSALLLFIFSSLIYIKHTFVQFLIHTILWLSGAYRGNYKKEILLIRLDALGDFLISAHLFETIAQEYRRRNYRIILIHTTTSAALVKYLPWFDETICIQKNERSFFKKITLCKKIAIRRAEIAVRCSTWLDADADSLPILCHSGAKFRYALKPLFYANLNAEGMGQAILPPDATNWKCRFISRHIQKRGYIQFTKAWKYWPFIPYINQAIDNQNQTSIFSQEAILASAVVGYTIFPKATRPDYLPECANPISITPYYVIVPGASLLARAWDTNKIATVIRIIHSFAPRYTPVFCGVGTEKQIITEIICQLPQSIHCIDLSDQTSIPQLNALVKSARFILANETGTCHLAALNQIPTIALLGGGHYGLFQPASVYSNITYVTVPPTEQKCFCCNWQCHILHNGKFPCVSRIQEKDVIQAIRQYLS